jgi:hypothetical protein
MQMTGKRTYGIVKRDVLCYVAGIFIGILIWQLIAIIAIALMGCKT